MDHEAVPPLAQQPAGNAPAMLAAAIPVTVDEYCFERVRLMLQIRCAVLDLWGCARLASCAHEGEGAGRSGTSLTHVLDCAVHLDIQTRL